MTYFKINNTDFSDCVNSLKINYAANYNAQTNAAGNTVVDYINSKREIEVGIIPLNDVKLANLLNAIGKFEVSISFTNPYDTTELANNVKCVLPKKNIEYYSIRVGNTSAKAFTLKFQEL